MTQAEAIGPGTLKLIVFDAQRDIVADIESVLREHVRADDIRRAGAHAFVLYCEQEVADVRDWLALLFDAGETLLVTEFERWSSRGDGVDRQWMLRRGH